MGFDAMAHDASVPAGPKDLAKKKRINRSAKLKQCKLDARREQWLSQVKNKGGCKATGMAASPPPARAPMPMPMPMPRPRAEEDRVRPGVGLQDSDLESPARSPASTLSASSSRKDCPSNNSISSGSSTGSCSRSASDGEEDGGTLEDWEAVADALSANHDDHHDFETINAASDPSTTIPPKSFIEAVKAGGGAATRPQPVRGPPRAWLPDDAFRPQSLPNLSKQRSFPAGMDMERHHSMAPWAHRGILAVPSSCPICYEDLDPTDSSFLPCSCGFRLCLFCHKRILEDDGRCPGCRKQYTPLEAGISGGVPPIKIRLSRSCSIKY